MIDFAGGAFHLLDDCREPFDNLVELTRRTCEGCCTVSVGDGVISKGDFDDIQEAIEKVKSMDMPGRVCILPGEYSLKDVVAIKEAKDLIVSGCGGQCVILAQGDDPAFAIANSNGVTLEWLTVVSKSTLGTIAVLGSEDVHILNCRVINGVKNEEGWEVFPALNVASEGDRASERFELADCVLRGLPAVTVQVDGARLSRNRLSGGGIWLREGTADVVARLNEIGEGAGPGILLGGLIPGEKPAGRLAGLARIDISANRIGTMAASGITTAGGKLDHEGSSKGFSLIDDLNIEGNEIEDCAWSESAIMFEEEAIGGVVLRNVAGLRIHANRIAGNGAGGKLPACGVYLDACYGNEITDNTILDNGPEDTESDGKLFQGGIIGRMLVAGSVRAEKNGKLGLVAGAGAAFVHDNIVVSPRGQALLLGALGSVSVAGNTLTSLEVAEQPLPAAVAEAARFGRCVFILNLGQAREMKGALSHYIKAADHFDLAAGGSGLNLKGVEGPGEVARRASAGPGEPDIASDGARLRRLSAFQRLHRPRLHGRHLSHRQPGAGRSAGGHRDRYRRCRGHRASVREQILGNSGHHAVLTVFLGEPEQRYRKPGHALHPGTGRGRQGRIQPGDLHRPLRHLQGQAGYRKGVGSG